MGGLGLIFVRLELASLMVDRDVCSSSVRLVDGLCNFLNLFNDYNYLSRVPSKDKLKSSLPCIIVCFLLQDPT